VGENNWGRPLERMTILKRINTALFILILALAATAVLPTLQALADEPVATVNGVVIGKEVYWELLERKFGGYAIQELVERELIRQKAEELSAEVNEEEFAELMELIVMQLGGVQGLQQFLQQNMITIEQFEEQMRHNALLSEMAKSEVTVNDEDLEAWFAENRHHFDEPESVEVSHILVDTEEDAEEILAALASGEDFAVLAQEKSLDPGTAAQGGYLGPITKGFTVQEFEDMAFSLAVDEHGTVESQFGWHIIWVQGKTEAKEAVFAESRDRVLVAYRNTNALDPQSYLSKLYKEAEIEVFQTAD